RDLDGARGARVIGDAQAAQLDIVLGRYRDLGVRLEATLAAAELGLGIGEDRLVAVDRHGSGLVGGGPEFPALHVAQVAEAAPVVAGAVLAPARDRHVAGAAVAAAGTGQHHVVAAIGQHLDRGAGRVWRTEHAQLAAIQLADRRRR